MSNAVLPLVVLTAVLTVLLRKTAATHQDRRRRLRGRLRSILVLAVPAAAVALFAGTSAHADVAGTIASAGPLTSITTSTDLNCSVDHAGDSSGEWFGDTACGTFLAVGGTLYGPANVPAGAGAAPLTGWVATSQSAVTGTGTTQDPYQLVTNVGTGNPDVTLTQTDVYVVGQESYRSTIVIHNIGSSAASGQLYRAGDCFLQGSDTGYGSHDASTGAVACTVSPDAGARTEQLLPLTSGSSYMEGAFSAVWSAVGSQAALPNTCDCDSNIDNGVGLSWPVAVAAGASSSYSVITTFSPQGILPLTMDVTADSPTAGEGGGDGYTVTVHNANGGDVTLTSLTDTLPAGFSYVSGSTTGVTTSEPTVAGSDLSWSSIVVPAASSVTLHFAVVVSSTPGTYKTSATATANVYTVTGTGPAAPITVGAGGGGSTAPVAHLTITPASGTAPLPVEATISASDADSTDLTYSVDWSDGSAASAGTLSTTTSSTPTLQHTFAAAGTYTVKLTVGDGTQNGSESQAVSVDATGPPPTAVDVSLTPSATSTAPGLSKIAINDIPTEQLKTFGVDVANAPNTKRAGIDNAPNTKRAPLVNVAPALDSAPNTKRAPLSEITVGYDGGWPALLAGTPLADVPVQSLTLGDVLDLLAHHLDQVPADSPLRTLGLGDLELEGSPLDVVTPAGLQLVATPVTSLVYADGATWCDVLAARSPHHETCASLGITGTTTLIALDLDPVARAVLDAVPQLRRPPIAPNLATFQSAHAPVIDARLDEENLVVTRVGDVLISAAVAHVPAVAAVQISAIPADRRSGVVDCAHGFDCTGKTLGDAAAAHALVPTATLTAGQQAWGTITIGDIAPVLPSTIEVNDVITGFLDANDFPWESLDLLSAGIQEYAPSHPTVHWTLTYKASGGSGPWSTTATADLPPGWRIVPPSITPTAPITVAGAPQLVQDGTGSHLTLTLAGTQPDTTHSLGFDAIPSLQLGDNAATATVQVASGSGTSEVAHVQVVEPAGSDAPATPADAGELGSDVLQLGYIATPGDVDLFGHTPASGAEDGVRLSHLAGDADLVLYGPPTDAQGSGPSGTASRDQGTGTPPIADAGYTGGSQSAQPTNDADLAGLPGQTVLASSATRDSEQESADADAVHTVEVRSYNGATSNLPYVLRIRETVPPPEPTCSAYARTGGSVGTYDSSSLPATVKTVLLVDQKRLGDTYSGPDVTALLAKLQEVAANANVQGAVIPVDGVSAVASAFGTWSTNPCSSKSANAVVAAIGKVIADVHASHPELANVVIVGGDDMIPFARLTDATRWGNERSYADNLGPDTALHGALASGHTLSDDPYGDLDPIRWLDRRLYVPDLAVGRLVETPAQITAQLQRFLDADGVLDPSSALSTGYDFMSDGAQSVTDALTRSLTTASGGTAPTIVDGANSISDSWSASNLLTDLGTGPKVASIDGHFDHNSGLSAAGFTGAAPDTFSAAQLANALPSGSRLVFSMGCHAGLNVPDTGESATTAVDNAQQLTAKGAVFLAATGFGYGDQVTVGLHERLMTMFAGNLDGSMSVGQAVWQAKQQYFAAQGLYGDYDEKVLSSTELYGLPMWRLTASPTVPVDPPTVTPEPAGGGLSTVDEHLTPTFVHKGGPDGEWYEVSRSGGGTFPPQATAGRPLQPRLDLDVTATSGSALLPAHGALVTALTTTESHDPSTGALSRPTLDETDAEPADTVTDLAFPSTFASITTATDPQGFAGPDGTPQRQRLVVLPGQYLGSAGNGAAGHQDLFGALDVRVFYSTSTDYTAPTFGISSGVVDAQAHTATFTTHASDASGITRALVLYDAGSGWTALPLTAATGDEWQAKVAVPAGATSVRWFVQAVDGAGNVGAATGKGAGLVAAPPHQASPVTITLTPAPVSNLLGVVPLVTVSGGAGVAYAVTVDTATPFTYAGPFTPSGLGTGVHFVWVTGSDGGKAVVAFGLDVTAPTVAAKLTPAPNAAGWVSKPPTVTFTCADVGAGVASCSPPVKVTTPSRATPVTGQAVDKLGHATIARITVAYDPTPPLVTSRVLRPAAPSAGKDATLVVVGSDSLSGVVGGEWFTAIGTKVGKGHPLALRNGQLITTLRVPASRVIRVRVRNAAGLWSTASTLNVRKGPQVLVSPRADRTHAQPLDGARLTGGAPLHVFVPAPTHARHVAFWLDDPRQRRAATRIDKAPPFELVLGPTLSAGSHTVLVVVQVANGSYVSVRATFVVRRARQGTSFRSL